MIRNIKYSNEACVDHCNLTVYCNILYFQTGANENTAAVLHIRFESFVQIYFQVK